MRESKFVFLHDEDEPLVPGVQGGGGGESVDESL